MRIYKNIFMIMVILIISGGLLFAGGDQENRPGPGPREQDDKVIHGPGNNPHFQNGDIIMIKVIGEELFLDAIAPEGRIAISPEPDNKPGTKWRIFQVEGNIIELRAMVPGDPFLDAIIPEENVGLAPERMPGTHWEFILTERGVRLRAMAEEGRMFLDAVLPENRLQLVPGPADDMPGTYFEVIFVE